MATTQTTVSPTRSGWRTQVRADVSALWRMFRSGSPLILLVPGITVLLVWFSQFTAWHSLLRKDFQEIVAPAVLAVATLLAGIVCFRHRVMFTGWVFALSAALLCRELHFWGTNNGIYVILILLFGFAARRYDRLQPFAGNRAVCSLLFGAMWAYFIAKTFDRGYWRKLFPAVESIRDAFEESIETTGHLLILLLVLAVWRIASRMRSDGQTKQYRRVVTMAIVGVLVAAGAAAAFVIHRSHKIDKPEPTRAPGELPYELSSICRVESAFGPDLFLVGSDEFRTLALCRIDATGGVDLLQDLELKIPQPGGGQLSLDDLEGLTSDGQGAYYAVTSHRQLNDDKEARRRTKSQGTERAVVRFELEKTTDGVRIVRPTFVVPDLLSLIRASKRLETINWHHAKSFRWRDLKSSWQIDIEGLAVCGDELLFGFKNPVEEGHATILALNLKTQQLTLASRPDFGGQGILGLNFVETSHELIAVTNAPLKGRYGVSRLWTAKRDPKTGRWQFGSRPSAVLEDGSQTQRKAAGIVRVNDRWIVCFGDDHQPVVRVVPISETSNSSK